MAQAVFLLILTLLHFAACQNFQDGSALDGQLTVIIEDNLSGGSADQELWEKRSVITIKNVKLGHASITHTRPWNENLTTKLEKLAKAGTFYRMRLFQQGSKESNFVYAFADACQLRTSGMREHITLMIDVTPSSGLLSQSLVGASVHSPDGGYCEADAKSAIRGYNTTVSVRTPAPSPVPDTATFIERMEAMNKEKMENKDNRSFLAKYWMYIIPVVLLLVISGGQDGGR
ncbi:hypothetical protein FHG87_000053 [Trinorchestia longiramus]|nr:hypothetical protein FHG87_000053 [Trinorchestia longiramus]